MMAARGQLRWWFAAFMLLLPLTTAWNLAVMSSYPKLAIKVGRKLDGVTAPVRPEFSWTAIRDGKFQRAVAVLVGEALPVRPFLIRVNNQVAFSLFNELNVPGLMIGEQRQLIEVSYLTEYCGRSERMAETLADRMIPRLLGIQDYYRSRGGNFLYVISPSKAAHLPEYFIGKIDCPNSVAARTTMIPDYAERLRRAGVAVFDAATFTHSLKGSYPVELFPRSGIHWDKIGVARASIELVKAINAQTGQETLRPFSFDYVVGGPPTGSDRDLADLINVLVPPLGYETAKPTYRPDNGCERHPARLIDAAVVGGSFMYEPSELLTHAACLSRLNLFFYLKMARYAGSPRLREQQSLSDADLAPLRNVKLLVLEENEQTVGRSNYVEPLSRILARP